MVDLMSLNIRIECTGSNWFYSHMVKLLVFKDESSQDTPCAANSLFTLRLWQHPLQTICWTLWLCCSFPRSLHSKGVSMWDTVKNCGKNDGNHDVLICSKQFLQPLDFSGFRGVSQHSPTNPHGACSKSPRVLHTLQPRPLCLWLWSNSKGQRNANG